MDAYDLTDPKHDDWADNLEDMAEQERDDD